MKEGRMRNNTARYCTVPEFVLDNLDSVAKLRRVMMWSPEYVASLICTSERLYSNIENAEVIPSRDLYNKLARIFDWEEWK